MFYLEKDVKISSAHHLNNYKGKCSRIHGHSWLITVYCKGEKLDKAGILVDFTLIKKKIVDAFDHYDLNKRLPVNINPTAENLAKFICEAIPLCWKVMVQEEEGSRCIYQKEAD